jgi:hypothetical protein
VPPDIAQDTSRNRYLEISPEPDKGIARDTWSKNTKEIGRRLHDLRGSNKARHASAAGRNP